MIVSDQKTARYGVMADPDWSSSRAAGSVTSQTQAPFATACHAAHSGIPNG